MDNAALSAAKCARLPLPQKPRLAPWVTLLDLGDNRLQLRSADFAYTLNYRLLCDAFLAIAPLLDGHHTVDEIADAGGPEVLPTTAIFVMKILRANGVLQEGALPTGASPGEASQWARQITFLSHFLVDPWPAQAVLTAARVAVLGTVNARESICAAIESIGIGVVRDTEDLDEKDWKDAILSGLGDPESTDLLVVALETPGSSVFEGVNSACLASGVRWLHVAGRGAGVVFGPTILPGQTACYACYSGRLKAHASDLDGFLAYENEVGLPAHQVDEGFLNPLWSIVAGEIALELARLMTGFTPPVTIGRFYELGASRPSRKGHDVLRLPRCPSCGTTTPSPEPWDLLDGSFAKRNQTTELDQE